MESEKTDFYANNVNIVSSIYDITLQFNTQTPVSIPTEPGKMPPLEVHDICNIRMSPQHAKALVAVLARNITQYENETKTRLALPPNLQEMWDTYVKQEK